MCVHNPHKYSINIFSDVYFSLLTNKILYICFKYRSWNDGTLLDYMASVRRFTPDQRQCIYEVRTYRCVWVNKYKWFLMFKRKRENKKERMRHTKEIFPCENTCRLKIEEKLCGIFFLLIFASLVFMYGIFLVYVRIDIIHKCVWMDILQKYVYRHNIEVKGM